MDTADGRRSPRFAAHLPVTVRAGRSEEHLLSAEVGLRGVFVVTDAPRPLRQLVTLEITLADGTLFEVQGMVSRAVTTEEAWTQSIPSGMGIQFYGLSRIASERWEAFLAEAERRHEEGLLPFGLEYPIQPADPARASTYVPPPPGQRGAAKATGAAPDRLEPRPARRSRPAGPAPAPEEPAGLDGPSTNPDLAPAPMDDVTEQNLPGPLVEDEPDTVKGKGAKKVRIAVAGPGRDRADTAATARQGPAARIPDELRDRLVERQGVFGSVRKPPAPKAPQPIEPFDDAEIPTQVTNRAASSAPAEAPASDDASQPDKTQEHVRPAEPSGAHQERPVTFDLEDFDEDRDESELTGESRGLGRSPGDPEGEPPTLTSPRWQVLGIQDERSTSGDSRDAERRPGDAAGREAEPGTPRPGEAEAWPQPPSGYAEDWSSSARPTAPAADGVEQDQDQRLAPDATSGAVVYRLALPTVRAMEEFGRTALAAHGVFVHTADVRPPGTPAVVCVLHPMCGDEFHLPGEVVPMRKGSVGVAVALTGVTDRTLEDFRIFVALGIPDEDQTNERVTDQPQYARDDEELTAVKPAMDEDGMERPIGENTLDIKASDLEALTAGMQGLDASDEALGELTGDLPDLFPPDDDA